MTNPDTLQSLSQRAQNLLRLASIAKARSNGRTAMTNPDTLQSLSPRAQNLLRRLVQELESTEVLYEYNATGDPQDDDYIAADLEDKLEGLIAVIECGDEAFWKRTVDVIQGEIDIDALHKRRARARIERSRRARFLIPEETE